MDDSCVCCGRYVPEGRMVCEICEQETNDMRINLYKSNKISIWKRFLVFLHNVHYL